MTKKSGIQKTNIIFEKFTEKHINEAVKLALCELEAERKHCPDLPECDFSEKLTGVLQWLCSQPFGKAAVCDGKLVGYLLFAGPWDGFLGDVKGVFSPLVGSAFSYEYENRSRLASMLFEKVAEEFVKCGVYSCALSRFAHDEETAQSFIMNGFGIRCCDAVREISTIKCQTASDNVLFEELPADKFRLIKPLQMELNKHLEESPVFLSSDDNGFESWFENWIKNETMRIFIAKSNGEIIGFISIDNDAENFITEYDKMKNICGAFFAERYRGNGVAQVLLAYVCDTLKAENITHLGVDYETLNPTALNFWGKSFVPYTYSYARRIDERISTYNCQNSKKMCADMK